MLIHRVNMYEHTEILEQTEEGIADVRKTYTGGGTTSTGRSCWRGRQEGLTLTCTPFLLLIC